MKRPAVRRGLSRIMVSVHVAAATIGLCVSITSSAGGPPGPEPFRRFAPIIDTSGLTLETDGAAGDAFGTALAVSGDWMVSGAPGDGVGGDLARGSAYLWQRTGDGWSLRQKLIANVGAAGDRFGAAVAIDGDTVAIGAPGDPNRPGGAAYVFERVGAAWQQVALLVGSAPMTRFGYAVAVDDGVIAIGAPGEPVPPASGAGLVQIHRRSVGGAWLEEARVVVADARDFGIAIDLDGNTLLVGAPQTNVAGQLRQGAAYVFEFAGGQWNPGPRLTGSLDVALDAFGTAIALDGDRAMVSAIPSPSSLNWPSRTAYVFTRSGTNWQETAQLFVDKLVGNSRFGSSLDLVGDMAAVGDDSLGNVYVFRANSAGWSPAERIQGSAVGGGLTGLVRIEGDRILVGSPSATVGDAIGQGAILSLSRSSNGWEAGSSIALAGADRVDLGSAWSISIDGVWLAVGMPTRDLVHVYRFDGSQWRLASRIKRTPAGVTGFGFGISVALSDGDLIVGAFRDAGRLFRYRFDGNDWAEASALVPTGAVAPRCFGYAMAVDGDTLLAGDPCARVGNFNDAGAGFIFVRQGGQWVHSATLVSDAPGPGVQLATSVALDQDWALLGSPFWYFGSGTGIPGPGFAGLYERAGSTWSLLRTWTGAIENGVPETLGWAVAVDAPRRVVVLGAPQRIDGSASDRLYGGIDLFRLVSSGWVLERIPGLRRPPDETFFIGGELGSVLSLRDGLLAVAAPRTSTTDPATDQWPFARVYGIDSAPSAEVQTVVAIGATSDLGLVRTTLLGPNGEWMIPRRDIDGPVPYGGANIGAIEVRDRNRLFSDEFE